MKNETIQQLKESNSKMENVFSFLQNSQDDPDSMVAVIFSALKLPDKEFDFVSEQILNECEKAINKIDDKLFLVQSLNANGVKVEDLNQMFQDLQKNIADNFKDSLTPQKIDFLKRFVGFLVNAVNDTEGIAKRIIPIPIELCHPDAVKPKYAKAGDAGMDVYAIEDTTINPGETKIIRTGLKCALPLGYEFEVRPRSGLSVKTPLRIANAPGTIDSGYRDEIGIIVTNTEPFIKDFGYDENGNINAKGILYGQSYTITKGMRFAQLVLKEVPACAFYEVSNVKEIGFDRAGGFGSSGVN